MGDFAHQMRWLADEAYTKAEKIRVVLDNLNTHRPASLYESFDPAEARRILKRLEFHYTPKHGSWLNMAEIELSSGPHDQDSGEAKIRESTAGVSRKPSSDGKARGCSSKHLCGLTAWNT